MKWTNESENNPGYSVYYSIPQRDPNVLYVIRQKKKTPTFKPKTWRVFARAQKGKPLKTIFDDPKLTQCKKFVEDWEQTVASS